jgi:histidinol dehydrogenase
VFACLTRPSLMGVSRAGAARLGRIAVTLAEGEGLPAHAGSAALRFR